MPSTAPFIACIAAVAIVCDESNVYHEGQIYTLIWCLVRDKAKPTTLAVLIAHNTGAARFE